MSALFNKFSGFIYGIISSATFGLIPLFAVPILNSGMGFMSVLLYRFTLATIALALLLVVRRESFKISFNDFLPLLFLAILYQISSVFLLWGYLFMPSGIATTLHFMYPVITTILMMLLFREKKSLWRMFAILMAVSGVYFLSDTSGGNDMSFLGIAIVLISAIGYASYLVTIGQLRNFKVRGLKLTFYVFLTGTIMLLIGMSATHTIEPIEHTDTMINLLLLAIIPTIISNLTLIEAIKRIGSTLTSVLGAMEPVTAVAVGIVAFGDTLTTAITTGIVLIISAVTIIILKR